MGASLFAIIPTLGLLVYGKKVAPWGAESLALAPCGSLGLLGWILEEEWTGYNCKTICFSSPCHLNP